jgi:DNA mismatch endonuclease (patch repair protein)
MTDVLSKLQRSYNMSRIRGSDTRPELMLRKAIWKQGLRYRLSVKLPGKPDLVFPRFKATVFIDGCFWHGCPIHLVWPKSNAAFWKKKINGNKLRDAIVTQQLKNYGWLVIRVWEHQIHKNPNQCALRIKRKLIGKATSN